MTRPDKTERSARWSAGRLSMLQQRFEESLLGEAAISGLVMVILLIAVVWNMPDSDIKRRMSPTLNPIATGFGLDQNWGVFAPEPIRRLETVDVPVTMATGATRGCG